MVSKAAIEEQKESWDSEEDEWVMTKIPSRHKRPEPHPTRAGTVSCLRCGQPFESWDKTKNRICPNCSGRGH